MDSLINNELGCSHQPPWHILRGYFGMREEAEETNERISWDNRLPRQNLNAGPPECKARILST
jgi:hypothetical protein